MKTCGYLNFLNPDPLGTGSRYNDLIMKKSKTSCIPTIGRHTASLLEVSTSILLELCELCISILNILKPAGME